MSKRFGAGLVMGVIGTVLVAVAAWLAIAYTGAYKVAASDTHADIVRWTLDTTMHRSVASRADGTVLPDRFSPEQIAAGAMHYAEYCAHCHGTPGETHWIVANGIKMSGMPAFGERHGPEEIVDLTAFITALPGLSAADYAGLVEQADAAHGHSPGG